MRRGGDQPALSTEQRTVLEQMEDIFNTTRRLKRPATVDFSSSGGSRTQEMARREGFRSAQLSESPQSPQKSIKRPASDELTTPAAKKAKEAEKRHTAVCQKVNPITYGAVPILIPRNPTPSPPPRQLPAPHHQTFSSATTFSPYYFSRPNLMATPAPQPRANTPVARTVPQAGNTVVNTATDPEDPTLAALAALDSLDDVMRERRRDNVMERALNKQHSTQGANSIVNNARTVMRNQIARIAEQEGEARRLKWRLSLLEDETDL
jgi:hypothetical protein